MQHVDPSQVPEAKNLATPAADTQDAAGAKPAGAAVIGKVDKLSGDAWIIHDGQKTPARVGATLMQGDSVETAQGAQISLVFADRTTFVLKDKGLVGLDEFIYDPATKTGKETFLVAQGAFSFVSGDIAKTQPDAARLATPVMSMGIRGTTVAGAVAEGGATSVALLPDPGSNFVGEVAITALGGGGQSFTLNSAGAGILGATSGGSWSVSANAGAAIATIVPAPVPPPPTPPALNGAPTGGGNTGTGNTGTGNTGGETRTTTPEPPPPPPQPITQPPPNPEPKPEPKQEPKPEPKPEPEPKPDPTPPRTNHDPTVTSTTNASADDHNGLTGGTIAASDVDGDTLSYRLSGGTALDATHDTKVTAHGTITLNTADGTFTFTPNASAASMGAGQTATDTAGVVISDGKGGTLTTDIGVDITGTNDAPTANGTVNLGGSPMAGVPSTISLASLLGNVTDADGDTPSITSVTASNGTAVISGSDVIYTPASSGTFTLSYTVSDGHGGTLTDHATTTVSAPANVAPTNSGPVTLTAGTEDTAFTVTQTQLLANAADANGDTLSITGLTTAQGTVTALGGGTYSITPNANFNGTLSLSYTIDDGQGGTVAGNATSVLAAVNDAPTANGTVNLGGSPMAGLASTISLASLLGNVTDADGDTPSITSVTASNGTAVISGSDVIYTPASSGTFTLSYTVSDGHGGTLTDYATTTVTPYDAAPQAHLVGTLGYAAAGTYQPAAAVDRNGTVADFNGDGLLDIAYYNDTAGLVLGLNNGGSFGASGFDMGIAAGTIASGRYEFGDVNRDGDTDLVKLDVNAGTVSFLYNNGAGTFTPGGQTISLSYPARVEVADLNGDAYPDLVVVRNAGLGDQVYLGSASGSFTVAGALGSAGAKCIEVADLNGDGYNDIVIGNWGAQGQVWMNDHTGHFTQTGTLSVWDMATGTTAQGATLDIEIRDFDGDGDKDIFFANRYTENMLYLNDGSGNFTRSTIAIGSAAIRPGSAAADVDNDGDMDVIVAVEGNDEIWLNDGGGTFTLSSITLDSNWNNGILAADFDKDGDVDLVDLASNNQPTTFYANTMLSPTGYTEGGTAATPFSGLVVSDSDNANLTSATITIGGYGAGDLLAFTDQNGITGTYSTGTLVLSGTTTLANYQTAVSSVTFLNSGTTMAAGDRTLNLTVSDGTRSSASLTKQIHVTVLDDTLSATAGTDTLNGGDGSNTYLVAPADFTAGDSIADSGTTAGNVDVLRVTATGTVDLSQGTVSGVERLELAAGGNTVILGGGADPQQFASITGGAGTDVLKLADSAGSLDLTGITLTSIESISTGAGNDTVLFDDVSAPGASVIVDGDASGGDSDTAVFFQTQAGTLDVSGKVFSFIEHVSMAVSGTSSGVTLAGAANVANTITGGAGDDVLVGGAAGDTLTGGVGADTLTGGAGADLFVYTATAQSQDAASSRDVITDFATGTDHIKLSLSGAHVDVSSFSSVASYNGGQATLALGGVVGDGFYSSFDQALYIYVQGNTTNIAADGGYVIGSANPIAAADLQFDITGTVGADTLVGGAGNDTFHATAGSDTIDGGGGTDTLTYAGQGTGITATVGGSGGTVIHGSGTDSVTGIEVLVGTTQSDTFIATSSPFGTVVGGGGNDHFVLASVAALTIDATGGGGTLSLDVAGRSAESLIEDFSWNGSDMTLGLEGAHNLVLVGNAANTLVDPSGHTVKLVGQGGADTAAQDYIVVGTGSDASLSGNTGDDILVWHSGNSSLVGGGGSDMADFRHAGGAVVADLYAGTSAVVGGSETVGLSSSITHVHGGNYNDTLTAGTGNWVLMGGGGDNTLDGSHGVTTVSYADSQGGVTVDLTAGTASHGGHTDVLTGISGVIGSDFNDTLIGGAGGTFLDGGFGANTVTGGAGADIFALHTSPDATVTQTINGFDGSDQFQLSDREFHLGASGTLTSGVNYGEGNTAISGSAQSFGTGTAGVVAIDTGGGSVELWHTTNMAAADTGNSHLIGTLNGVNTSALDNTNFHLAV